MKRSALGFSRPTVLPVAWREAEYAAAKLISSDTCDDRVSDSIYDAEDERAEVDHIVQQMHRDAN